MLAAQESQRRRIECLHTEGNAVHTGAAEILQAQSLDARWVGFQGNLEIRLGVEDCRGLIDQIAHGCRLHQAWGAATEKNGSQRAATEALCLPRKLRPQGGGKARLINPVSNMRIEVAIGALGETERPMDIKG